MISVSDGNCEATTNKQVYASISGHKRNGTVHLTSKKCFLFVNVRKSPSLPPGPPGEWLRPQKRQVHTGLKWQFDFLTLEFVWSPQQRWCDIAVETFSETECARTVMENALASKVWEPQSTKFVLASGAPGPQWVDAQHTRTETM